METFSWVPPDLCDFNNAYWKMDVFLHCMGKILEQNICASLRESEIDDSTV